MDGLWFAGATVIAFVAMRFAFAYLSRRGSASDEVIFQSATKKTKPSVFHAFMSAVTPLLIVQVLISAAVLSFALPVLALADENHAWRSGAQYSLGIVIGFWLNSKSARGR